MIPTLLWYFDGEIGQGDVCYDIYGLGNILIIQEAVLTASISKKRALRIAQTIPGFRQGTE